MTDAEIIRTLATKCMGWTSVHERYAPHCGCSMVYDQRGEYLGKRFVGPACGMTVHVERDRWNPLSSISDAFMVAETLTLDLIKVDDGWMVGDGSSGYSNDDGVVEMKLRHFAIAPTACRAICLAAIAALEGK